MPTMPFRGSDAVARGVVSKNELRGPRFCRLFPDVYIRREQDPPDHMTMSRAAFLLVERKGGVLGGYSAATLLGADCAPKGAQAEVIVPADQRTHPGLLVRRGNVTGADLWKGKGCLVTSPERTAWDVARRLNLVEAVVAVDALALLRIEGMRPFKPADLLRRRQTEPGARGCRRLDRVVALAGPGAESPMETRLRLLLVLAGLPTPLVQYKLRDEYDLVIATFDLAYPDAMLAIEYDGLDHARREFTNDDRWRDVTTGDFGWHTMRFGYQDIRITPRRTIEAVANMRQRRLRLLGRSPNST
jgi:very-short-patch-repair endonuclease